MLKQGLINRDLLACAAELGHTDSFVIADCGLPIPEHVPVVDVSLEFGYPEFFDVAGRLLPHIVAGSVVVAKEAPPRLVRNLPSMCQMRSKRLSAMRSSSGWLRTRSSWYAPVLWFRIRMWSSAAACPSRFLATWRQSVRPGAAGRKRAPWSGISLVSP